MSLYPSLEDMKVDQMARAQISHIHAVTVAPEATANTVPPYPVETRRIDVSSDECHRLYPTINDYMGLSLSSGELNLLHQSQNAVAVRPAAQVATQSGGQSMIAPLSGSSVGLQRAQVTHGLREITLCKDQKGRIGLRVKSVNKGVFVVLVSASSPAAMVGLRFGDQILQINDEVVAGYTMDKVHSLFKKAPTNGIRVVVRDRPFERTITLHKDSTGHIGFSFKNGVINSIVKDSSAARNGLLIDHCLLEINGQNVVGVEDKLTRSIIDAGGNIITLTIMPQSIYDHMVKSMASSLVKKLMDHSIPEI